MLTNDIINNQKGKKANTKDNTTQNKGSHAMKMILRLGTPKISTTEKKMPKAWYKEYGVEFEGNDNIYEK